MPLTKKTVVSWAEHVGQVALAALCLAATALILKLLWLAFRFGWNLL